jgi:cytochrome P450 family 619
VPERFLGNWRTRAKVVHDALHELYEGLLASVLRRREAIGPTDCIIDQLLDGQEKSELTTHQIAFLSGVTIKGGSDTSASVLASTMQALVTWPEVQRKAHAEIDAVVGEDRLPTWDDYAQLPYIAAMVKESHRWRPVAPLGVPHALSEGEHCCMLQTDICLLFSDEWIDGKFLPKGTILFVNVWGLHHDESRYEDHDVFDPDHFKGNTVLAADSANSADFEKRDHYGYGASRSPQNGPESHLLLTQHIRQRPKNLSRYTSSRSQPLSRHLEDSLGIQD